MQIIVDNTKVDIKLPERDVPLQQVIDEVETFLLGVGKVPVGLTIDGKALTQEELETRQKELLKGSETIEFGVITIFAFLQNNLDGAAQANEELLKSISAFAEEIHTTEKSVDGSQLVLELNHFFDFWLRLKGFLPDEFAALDFDGKSFQQLFDGLRALFEEAVAAMEENDFVLAGDLLQYEVVPAIESVHRAIPSLK